MVLYNNRKIELEVKEPNIEADKKENCIDVT